MIGSNLLLTCMVAGFLLVLFSVLMMFHRRRRFRQRREGLLNSEIDSQWEGILEENFPLYRKMPDDVRRRLGGYVNAFVEEKSFEGCGGLGQLTDEMLVTIAGQACILLLNGKFGVLTHFNQCCFTRTLMMLWIPWTGADSVRKESTSGRILGVGICCSLLGSCHERTRVSG